jgi:hypothetical protein
LCGVFGRGYRFALLCFLREWGVDADAWRLSRPAPPPRRRSRFWAVLTTTLIGSGIAALGTAAALPGRTPTA